MAILETIERRHARLTLSDWDELDPDDGYRTECIEGVLVVAPTPSDRHQKSMSRLVQLLDEQLPPELNAVPDMDVLLNRDPLTVRAPDVIVAPTALYGTGLKHYPAQEVRLAVEIVSPSSRGIDRVSKFNQYARAGVGEYWILDGDPLTLSAYVLESGAYRLVDTFTGTAELTTCGVPVRIDLDRLTRRRV